MISGTALALSELPLELMTQHALERRIRDHGGETRNAIFVRRGRATAAGLARRPAGNPSLGQPPRGKRSCPVPAGRSWTRSKVAAGESACVKPVIIPATMGLDKGVWYRIRQGMPGLVVSDERRCPRVYVICEPASHYYQVMTRGSRWMPALLGERSKSWWTKRSRDRKGAVIPPLPYGRGSALSGVSVIFRNSMGP